MELESVGGDGDDDEDDDNVEIIEELSCFCLSIVHVCIQYMFAAKSGCSAVCSMCLKSALLVVWTMKLAGSKLCLCLLVPCLKLCATPV